MSKPKKLLLTLIYHKIIKKNSLVGSKKVQNDIKTAKNQKKILLNKSYQSTCLNHKKNIFQALQQPQ